MPDSLKPPYLRKDETRGDIQVWIVDGPYIRGHKDEEFTNFGQHYRFPYIPEKEFWIDQEAENDERAFFIEHPTARPTMSPGAWRSGAATVRTSSTMPLPPKVGHRPRRSTSDRF